MIEKVITDNAVETITIRWDGQRFALIHKKRLGSNCGFDHATGYSTVILNLREMSDLIVFARSIKTYTRGEG